MADRWWVNGGNGNFNSSTNWSATDGGSSGASVPTNVDDIFFSANGNSNSTINATITVKSMTIGTGYTATMTHNAVLTVAGNITLGANYTIAGSSSITMSATGTITSNGKTWPNDFTSTNSKTITLVSNFIIGGTFILGNGAHTINKTTTETLTVGGLSQTNGNILGTLQKLIITGGTWVAGTSNTSISTIPVDLQGNITIGSIIAINTFVILTYVSGTITTTGSTLHLINNCTLNTAGVTWNNVNMTTNNPTITINSLFSVGGTFTTSVSTTFNGTHGWVINSFNGTHTSVNTIDLKEGITYRITNSLVANTSRVNSTFLLTSSHASTKAILTLDYGATCACLANFTRIDASNGRPIRSFNGTITDCLNIQSFYDLKTVAG